MQANPFPFRRPVRVDMVPLIDMFFLLLVFFMFGLFHMTMQQGLLVELPSATSVRAVQEDVVTVSVTAEGVVAVNQRPVADEALDAALRQERARLGTPLVLINGDRRAPHGRVVTVLDALRRVGLSRVSFQTSPETSPGLNAQ
jgi:biopolymer transport protein ExbD